jgi:hypothetical protein
MRSKPSRRSRERYQVKDGAFAVLFQDSFKLGQIIDISMAGFAFRYSDNPFMDNDRDGQALLYHQQHDQLEGLAQFDIFLVDSGIYLDQIPCKIISQVEVDSPETANAVVMKRCGLAFEKLLPEQIADLSYFIQHCTRASD